jgi:hypothetical protein
MSDRIVAAAAESGRADLNTAGAMLHAGIVYGVVGAGLCALIRLVPGRSADLPVSSVPIAGGLAALFVLGIATWPNVRLNERGVRIANWFRFHHVAWSDIASLDDGSVALTPWTHTWALEVRCANGRTITCVATSLGGRKETAQIIKSVTVVAARHDRPCTCRHGTGSATRASD